MAAKGIIFHCKKAFSVRSEISAIPHLMYYGTISLLSYGTIVLVHSLFFSDYSTMYWCSPRTVCRSRLSQWVCIYWHLVESRPGRGGLEPERGQFSQTKKSVSDSIFEIIELNFDVLIQLFSKCPHFYKKMEEFSLFILIKTRFFPRNSWIFTYCENNFRIKL